MAKCEKRHFTRYNHKADLVLTFPNEDGNTSTVNSRTLSLGNGGALIETSEDISSYNESLGNACISINSLWKIAKGTEVQVPFQILRIEKLKSSKKPKYRVALKFFLLTPPYLDPSYIKVNLTSAFGEVARRSETIYMFLEGILFNVINICSAKGGYLFLRDDCAIKPPLNTKNPNLQTTSELVLCATEGVLLSDQSHTHIPFDFSPEEEPDMFNEEIENKLSEIPKMTNTVPYILSIAANEHLCGIIYILMPKNERLYKKSHKLIEESLAEACKLLHMIVDRFLQRNLSGLNRTSLSLQYSNPSDFICCALKEASAHLQCTGTSFFVRDISSILPKFTMVGTFPKPMPKETIIYSFKDSNWTSRVLHSNTRSILQYSTTECNELNTSIWKDIPNEEKIKSVMFIPVVNKENIIGLLRCTNKSSNSPQLYFHNIDLYCADALASLLMTWYMAAKREYCFTSSLLDISHEINTSASGIKWSALYIKRHFLETLVNEEDKLMHKISGIIYSTNNLLRMLPALKKDFKNDGIQMGSTFGKSRQLKFLPYAELCKPICEIFSEKAKKRNIRIIIKGKHQLGWIFADLEDFKHIFQNIISNAVKYTDKGNNITVKIQRLSTSNGNAMIHTISRSLPILSDEMEEIFRPRYRSVATKNTDIEGDGLGLTIARAIARQYNADIILRSRNNYNIFSIIVPTELFHIQM